MEIEQQCREILKRYLVLAEKEYGKLPQHCYETKIEFFSLKENPSESHYADTIRNVLMINKNYLKDIEWTIFHEMEHIRTAKEIGKSTLGGVRVYPYPHNSKEIQFDSVNEALTDMSVEKLLGRKDTSVGYFETIQLTRQMGALIGFENDSQLLDYYRLGGYDDLKLYFENEFNDNNSFLRLQIILDTLHEYHIKDIAYEFDKFGEIKNKPLGSIVGENTKKYRRLYHDYILILLLKLKDTNKITEQEFTKRLKALKNLSPYKNNELSKDNLLGV